MNEEEYMLTLYDNRNTVVFPLKAEEVLFLLADKAGFEKYLLVGFNAAKIEGRYEEKLIECVQEYKDGKTKGEYTNLFAVVSASHKTIVGTVFVKTKDKMAVLDVEFNEEYKASGCLFCSLELISNYLKENGFEKIKIASNGAKFENMTYENLNFKSKGNDVFEKDCNENK